MIITTHAKVRALERLLDVQLKGNTDEEKLASDFIVSARVEQFLLKSITPSMGMAFSLEGCKYNAMIDGFDKYRAVIGVVNGQHILITIIPIY